MEFSDQFNQGSSPLTRGKLLDRVLDGVHAGLIPAHAGKTYRSGPSACGRPAHPRSRGENSCHYQLFSSQNGSSPLTRGKLDRGLTAPKVSGLIPAHAGKTSVSMQG